MQTMLLPQELWFGLEEQRWDEIREETGGRIDVTVYPDGALVPFEDILDSIRAGVIEMGYTTYSYHQDFAPSFGFAYGMPGFLTNYYDNYNILYVYGLADLWQEDLLDKTNGELLNWASSCDEAVMMSNEPIRSMADFKGLKVRTLGKAAEWFTKMGAAATFVPGSEIYTALSTGLVDVAFYGSFSPNKDLKLNEVAKYYTMPPCLGGGAVGHFIGKEVFDSLPHDLQIYLENKLVADWGLYSKAYLDDILQAKHEIFEKQCTESRIPQSEVDKMNVLAWEVIDTMAKDAASEKALAIFKQYLKDKAEWSGK